MRISDWSSDVCSSDLAFPPVMGSHPPLFPTQARSTAAGSGLPAQAGSCESQPDPLPWAVAVTRHHSGVAEAGSGDASHYLPLGAEKLGRQRPEQPPNVGHRRIDHDRRLWKAQSLTKWEDRKSVA